MRFKMKSLDVSAPAIVNLETKWRSEWRISS